MKVFATLICTVIGHVLGELESSKDGARNTRVSKDFVKDDDSRVFVDDDKTPAAHVESLRGKYAKSNIYAQVPESVKSTDSIGTDSSRKPSPVIEISTVKPTSFKAVKNNAAITSFRKPAKRLNMLKNIFNAKNTNSETGWIDYLRSFLRDKDALR